MYMSDVILCCFSLATVYLSRGRDFVPKQACGVEPRVPCAAFVGLGLRGPLLQAFASHW